MKLSKEKITINIDTTGLTLGELLEELETLFPNGKWADFEIEEGLKISAYPIVIERSYPYRYPCNTEPIFIYGANKTCLNTNSDTSNITNTDLYSHDLNSIDFKINST